MNGYQIHIKGRVQGVGFRPFVYNLAKSFHLNGSVRNTSSGVYIDLIADKFIADQFVFTLESNPPPKSIIESISTKPFEVEVSDDFRIVESTPSDKVDLKISPDFAMCSNCLDELESTTDRRARYAFITCSECGPRYSIQSKVPYDRFDTTMNAFHMCSACYEEYHDPSNRRFFSQTNSCGECGITLSLYDEAGQIEGRSQDELIDLACSSILKGKTVAVKGIGGYLLLCDPTNPDVLRTLRARKHRPDKPFALLFPDIDSISKIADIHEAEESLLRSEVSPIVILDRRENDNTSICWDLVSPDLPNAGVMLPYAPLLHLIAKRFDNGLIATSANISGGPILFKDDEARDQLFVFADLMLSHSREILIPQDDSVAKVVDGQVIWMRRSRGLAPSYFGSLPVHLENGILALGAHMKSSFALSEGNNWHVSQYLGSLDEYESQTTYLKTLSHVRSLFRAPIKRVLTDSHPGYFVHSKAREIAVQEGIPVESFQHHESHFAAVLQENDLIHDQEVLGVIWDGTGWGTDNEIWGGEIFSYSSYELERLFHINYVPIIANDKMAKEPRLSALTFCHELDGSAKLLKSKFSAVEWKNYQAALSKTGKLTSSMGRLFDAVASLIGLIDTTTYEGQAAMLLETCAKRSSIEISDAYPIYFNDKLICTDALFEGIIYDLQNGKTQSYIARRFHFSLVLLIREIALKVGFNKIAFSGGVFQNSLLVSLLRKHLSNEFQLYFHKELPPNDENISFGQLAQYHLQQSKNAALNHENYVSSNTW